MGRASRLKDNPDRQRYRLQQLRKSPGQYVAPSGMSFPDMVRATAFHEAGHIVSALSLGIRRVGFAILNADLAKQGVGGYTELHLGKVEDGQTAEQAVAMTVTPEMLHKRTVQALAGAYGECLVSERHDDVSVGATDDDERALRFAVMATRPTPDEAGRVVAEAYLAARREDARNLILSELASVQAVANYLLSHPNQEVDGDTLAGLMVRRQEVGR